MQITVSMLTLDCTQHCIIWKNKLTYIPMVKIKSKLKQNKKQKTNCSQFRSLQIVTFSLTYLCTFFLNRFNVSLSFIDSGSSLYSFNPS